MFYEKVGNHTYRYENLFYLNALLTKQILRLEEILTGSNFNNNTFNSGNITDIELIKHKFNDYYSKHKINLTEYINKDRNNINEQDLRKVTARINELDKIIDCIACEKTKLNLKIQLMGIETMLKMMEDKSNKISLEAYSKNEIVVYILIVLFTIEPIPTVLQNFKCY